MTEPSDDEGRPLVDPELLLALAERVMSVLESRSLDALVIGAFALAVHRYPRATHDLDLGLNASIKEMEQVRDDLLGLGLRAEWEPPDANDPLGGTLTIVDEHNAVVQVINYASPSTFVQRLGIPRVVWARLACGRED